MDHLDRFEASLSEEGRYRLLIDAITDYAIYMLDAGGLVSSWNPGAERFKGYRAHEIVGQHFSRFYTLEDQAAGAPMISLQTAALHGRCEMEGWRLRKNGQRFWAHVIIDPIRDDAGELIGFAKVTRDVTERREARQALEQARETLFQSQKIDALGQLTGGVAHDFNNLLTAVLGSLELVRKRLPFDPRITPLLDNAVQGAQRGAALTQRMLAFARRQELKLEAVQLSDLVGDLLGFLERSLGPSVAITTRFASDLPLVRTDVNQLEAALLNLVVNARDAMRDGGVITIAADRMGVTEAGAEPPPGDYVRMTVSDTGAGMAPEVLARATEPFFTTKGLGKGTGLGLSMVHGLVAQSGGGLTIESQAGEGTTITLWLPVATGVSAAAPRKVAPVLPPQARRMTILVVDDDPLVLMNTAALLEDLGHRIITAASGAEALGAMERRPAPELVITDQAMPQMTGLQLRAALAVARPALPVLIATGYADMAGADPEVRKISKPFTQDELAAAVMAMAPPPQTSR